MSEPRTATPPKRVKCLDTGEVFNSIKEAARQYSCSPQRISMCCRGKKYKTTAGVHWGYADE